MNKHIVKDFENKPKTSANFFVNLFCCVLFFAVMYWLRWFFPQEKTIHLVLIGLIVSVAPLWLYDLLGLKVYERPSTGLTKPGEMNFQRLILKLIGLYFTYFVILIFYKLNSFYYVSAKAIDFYGNFFSVLYEWGPFFILISAFYFWIVDRRQKNPYDEYWQMGCFLTGRFKEVKGVVLKEYVKGWFIKAFFIPLMFGLLVIYVDIVLQARWDGASFVPLYNQFLDVFYAVDILFGVLGYVLALRLLDTHIQSTEPTVLGWFVCLACYSPF